mgnify:CR=1 FL=1
MRFSPEFRSTILTLTASTLAGALSGFIAGWIAAGASFDLSNPAATSTGAYPAFQASTGTPSAPEVTVISVDRKPSEPIMPPAFVERRSSSMATVYRKSAARKIAEENLLTDDRMLGQAVAVTSDGWFAMPRALLDGLHFSDLVIWHDGGTATATRAVSDRMSGVVFVKTDLGGLTAPALARLHDVSVGLPVWVERRPRYFEPRNVAAQTTPVASLDGTSSEIANRRPVAGGVAATGDLGAAVWSTNGNLIGFASSAPGEPLRFIPTTAWAQSLQSLLSNNEARHAFLGARSVDLSALRLEQTEPRQTGELLPERGAWLRDDKRNKKPAVDRNSPAAMAGLRAGDVIQKIDRDIIDGSAEIAEFLAEYKPKAQVTLTVLRGKETLEVPVTLGSIVTSEELK